MKKGLLKYFTALFIVLLCVNAAVQAKDFYVAPTGSDEALGAVDDPFASFAYAKSKVKEYKLANPSDPITVYFRGGKYYMSEPVVFTQEDGGTEAAPITYKAYQEEVPEILGGEKLEGLSWTSVDGKIYKTSVPDGLVFETLFVNGAKKILARYPNYNENAEVFNGTAADCIDASKVATWADPTGGYVHALHGNRWGGIHYRITSKSGTKLNLEGGTQNNRGSGMHGTYRFVENIFEELDSIDEWYLNRNTSELYYYPAEGISLDEAEIEYAAQEQLIVFDGTIDAPVKYISIEGMQLKRTIRTFMKTADPLLRSDWTIYRGGVVHFEGTENCSLLDCELTLLGGNAVFFNEYNKNSSVEGCHIYDVGGSGVCFVGDVESARHLNYNVGTAVELDVLDFTRGPKNDNYPQYCSVDNNLIHNIGTIEKQTAGVHMSLSAYITVSRNSIYDVPRAGINISEGKWSGHMIEYNDVFKTVLETEDHGAFNSWGRDRYYSKDRGITNTRVGLHGESLVLLDILDSTVIRNNRFRCDHGWDIDLDDGSSYYHIYNNVCLSGGIKLRDGFYRTVENNITINSSMHQHVWLENSGDIIQNNIFTHGYFPIGMGNWGKLVDSNLFYLESDLENIQNQFGVDDNSIFGDPLFANPAIGDYTVGDSSIAFDIGFKNIPMDQFGVQVPKLKAIAETPEIPEIELSPDVIIPGTDYYEGIIKNIETDGELSAAGLGEMKGAMVMKSPDKWVYSIVELLVSDVVLKLDDEDINDIDDLISKLTSASTYSTMSVWRYQEIIVLDLPDLSDCSVPTLLDSREWELVSTNSENSGYQATNAIDNNIGSFWHTEFDPSDDPYPHELVVDMGAPYVLDYLELYGRQGHSGQRIKEFEIYVTSNLKKWGEPVLEGTLQNTDALQSVKIEKDNDGQYFKFVALSGYSRQASCIGEIDFYGSCGVNEPASPYDRIEAETNDEASGITFAPTTDVDGDEELGDVEDGDYIVFTNLNLAEADSIRARVASSVGGVIELRVGSATKGNIIAFIDVPNTGSSNTWQTVSVPISVVGDEDIYFVFKGEGSDFLKLNWIQLVKNISSFPRIEVEAYTTAIEGLKTYASSDADDNGTGEMMRLIKPDYWLHFADVDLTHAKSISTRYATGYEDASVEVRIGALDGELIATIDLDNTGGWSIWGNASSNISDVTGIHDVYFVFRTEGSNYVCTSNWFQFSEFEVDKIHESLGRIEIEAYDWADGIITTATSDVDGEQELGAIQNKDWILFKNIDLTDVTNVDMRYATPNDGGRIDVRLGAYNGDLLGFIMLPNTDSKWETSNSSLFSSAEGIHDVYFICSGSSDDLYKLNWFQFHTETSALPDNDFGSKVNIYPNPVLDVLNIEVSDSKMAKVSILNMLGEVMIDEVAIENSMALNIARLEDGFFIVKMEVDGAVLSYKLLKK